MTAILTICEHCGSWNGDHDWREGDCVLNHRGHSRNLLTGTNICRPCIDRHKEWLTEILDLWAELPDVIAAGSVADDTADHKRPKKAAEQPAPFRLDAWAMTVDRSRLAPVTRRLDGSGDPSGYLRSALPDIPALLMGWARNILEDQGLTGGSVTGSSSAVHILTVHADRIAHAPWIDEYDAELAWCRTALRRAHGISDGPPPLGPCITVTDSGSCTGTVWPDPDHGKPRCDRCRRRYGTLDLVRLKMMRKGTA